MQESREEQIERIHLMREYKLSELILEKKREELKHENNKFKELNNSLSSINKQNKINKINKLNEEIKQFVSINEKIKKENKMKSDKLKQLLDKLNEGKPIPLFINEENDSNDNDDEEKYEFEYYY